MSFIENEAAYEKGKQAAIRFNRIKGNRKRWVAESGQQIVDRCTDFLAETGEFGRVVVRNKDGWEEFETNPFVKVSFGEFYRKMHKSLLDWGRLSPAQEKAVLGMIEKAQERIAERAAAKEAKAASAQHIGAVGERRGFELTIKFMTSFETRFGYTFVHVMEDAAGNVVVYKGSKAIGQKGDSVSLTATIKEHGVRDGIAQTIIARPAQH